MSSEIRTATRKMFDVLNPRHEDVDVIDIAVALANIQRYGGHYPVPNSVAAHSIRVATIVDAPHKLDALFHDASEAYLGDVVSPLKHTPEMAGYAATESRVQQVISEAIGLTWPIPRPVIKADKHDGEVERYMWACGVDRARLKDCTAGDFLRVYNDLTGINLYDEWYVRFGKVN